MVIHHTKGADHNKVLPDAFEELTMPFCNQCGGEIGEENRFCTYCGAMQVVVSVAQGGSPAPFEEPREPQKLFLWLSLTVIAVLLICAVFAPLLAPHDPTEVSLLEAKIAPGKDLTYPLGTDILGQDMLSRLIYGARTSVLVILGAVCISAAIGTMLGLVAGYCGGWVDRIIVGPTAAINGLPTWGRIVVSILIGSQIGMVVATLGVGIFNVVVAVAVLGIPRVSLAVRNTILGVRNWKPPATAEIDDSARPGNPGPRVLTSVIITLLIVGSLQAKQIILAEAFFTFLGIGIRIGEPAWSIMVSEGRSNLINMWWLSLLPSAAIAVMSAAFYCWGRWVQDTLEPRLPQRPRGWRI